MKTAGCLSVALALTTFAACDGSTVSPSQAGSPQPSSSGSVPRLGGFSLTGAVVESSSASVQGGTILFSLDSRPEGHVAVDGHGRYTIPNLPVGHLVRVTWRGPAALDRLLHQLYPVNTTITGDTKLDIEVVRLDSAEFACAASTLSGVVYETTAQGRRPLTGMRLFYSINNWDGYDAFTHTDADGRYTLCRIPRGVGRVGAGDCNDAVLPVVVNVNGDTVVDFDLTSFNASCPGARRPSSGG